MQLGLPNSGVDLGETSNVGVGFTKSPMVGIDTLMEGIELPSSMTKANLRSQQQS